MRRALNLLGNPFWHVLAVVALVVWISRIRGSAEPYDEDLATLPIVIQSPEVRLVTGTPGHPRALLHPRARFDERFARPANP
jgi:hypothetical protein